MTDVSASAPQAPEGSAPANLASIPAEQAQAIAQKLKIDWGDGNAEEMSPDDLISNYKLTRRQAEQLKNQVDPVMQFLMGLQGGDLDSLSHLNIPEDKMLDFAERVLTKKLEFEQMSPAEKALRQKEREIAERERQYKEWQSQQEKAQREQLSQQALGQVQTDIIEAIKDLGLKGRPTPRLIRRVAEQLKAQIESQKPMDAKRASKHEWDNIQSELRDFQMMMLQEDPDKFVESLPKEIRKAIRDYEVKAGTPFKRATNDDATGNKSGGVVRDFDYLEKLYGEKPKRRMK